MSKLKSLFGAAVLAAAVVMPAQADLVLDTFDYAAIPAPGTGGVYTFDDDDVFMLPDTFGAGVDPALTQATDPITGVSGTVVGLSAFGGLTTYDFNALPSPASVANPNLATGDGELALSGGNNAGYSATISYSDPTGGATPQNFAAAGSNFYFDVAQADFGFSNDFTVDLTVIDSSMTSVTSAVSVPSGAITNATLTKSFSDFVGIDFTQIIGVFAVITSAGTSVDITLTEVGIVPEPSALAILGLGLVALGLRRRKLV